MRRFSILSAILPDNIFLRSLFMVFLAISAPQMINAQCYNAAREEGIESYNDKNYERALLCFETARDCPDVPASNDLNSWIAWSKSLLRAQNEKEVFENVVESNTLSAYIDYLESYPDGGYNDLIYNRLPEVLKKEMGWVNIPSGTFLMGSPLSEPMRDTFEIQHKVTLNAFKMTEYEITFTQYDLFCKATGRKKPDDNGWGRGDRPVINVNWEDAKSFAEWLDCRLPTEAEWEYACRAGTTTAFSTGNNLTTSQANYNGNYPYNNNAKGVYREKTLPEGNFAPNAWGLYDMHGNAWEWCSDWCTDYRGAFPLSEQAPPWLGRDGFRICRGGSWDMEAQYCRSSYRDYDYKYRQNYRIGFRLCSSE
jgi:formylglycine-generating enzyme